jgi:GTPase SAR1 family protein
MSQTNPLIGPEAAREARTTTLDLLDRLAALASEYDLPRPPDALEVYRKQLWENRYTVLVAGEAKRGKSTFVNALLGRELLPTDVDIATCQVFRVRQAPDEAFRVRYEDESVAPITAEDLARFGSQVLADLGEVPRLSQMTRWIEVEGPIHFLPNEISLLDTPGLGSLYAAHARITRRYLPLADAVIFVLASDSPIGREEIQFLGEILAVTRRVLFIQTMIDRYSREHWQTIQARNEQILAETFGDRLLDHRVWPISSTNLLTAARTGDVDFEQVSRFRPLASALQAFLFRAAGLNRAAEAIVLASDYHRSGRP